MLVHYKCRCIPRETTIMVPDRRPGGAIEDWMNVVQHCIGMDHKALSPLCRATEMEYCKIPLADENSPIGVPPTKN